MLLPMLALFCCGGFFGAALYISLVQHPALLTAGVTCAKQFFPPMYTRAAPLQITFAGGGFVAALGAWWMGLGVLWLVGGLWLISVIPITLWFLRPINTQLLGNDSTRADAETETLLRQWGARHWLRTVASGVAFVLYLCAW